MGYRPPAPIPLTKRPNTLSLLFNLWRNPLLICGDRHFTEPIISEQTPLGHITLVNEPEGIHHVLVDRSADYPKDERQLRILQPGLRTGLLTSSGDTWKVARHALAPLFTPRAVETHANVMEQCGQRMVQRLNQCRNRDLVDVSAELGQTTFDIISSLLFSNEALTDSHTFVRSLSRYFGSQGRIDPLDAIGAPMWIPRLGLYRAKKAIRFFEDLAGRVIAHRRRRMAKGISPPRDLLTLLLEAKNPQTGEPLSRSDIAGSIITFIGAGHETTANTLAWTLFLLAKHPHVLSIVEQEIDSCTSEDLACLSDKLLMTRAVIDEAMRLYPPAPIMARTARRADEILGKHVPRGSTVIIAPYIVHRHRRLWDQPDYFRPERFLPGAKEPVSPYAFLPFGAGPRICIGHRFSQMETVILLATLLRSLRFVLPPNERVFPVHHVTLRPSPRLMMHVTPRS